MGPAARRLLHQHGPNSSDNDDGWQQQHYKPRSTIGGRMLWFLALGGLVLLCLGVAQWKYHYLVELAAEAEGGKELLLISPAAKLPAKAALSTFKTMRKQQESHSQQDMNGHAHVSSIPTTTATGQEREESVAGQNDVLRRQKYNNNPSTTVEESEQNAHDRSDRMDGVNGNENEVERLSIHEIVEPLRLFTFRDPDCLGPIKNQANVTSLLEPTVALELKSPLPKSARVDGPGLVEFYNGQKYMYRGTIVALEGCVNLYGLATESRNAKFVLRAARQTADKSDPTTIVLATRQPQILPQLQLTFSTAKNLSQPHARIVFSATSSSYFGYQVYANALGFLQSKQTNASWTRLLSASEPDDLSYNMFPTFTAPKSLYSLRYEPIHKVDVILKWLESADAPHSNDTIVVIDPDNWLLKDVHNWTLRVTDKNALGMVSYYRRNKLVVQLWKELCPKHACGHTPDEVGVPYVVKATKLKDIAPLWRSYTITIKDLAVSNSTFAQTYESLGVHWIAEMLGYNFACAHLNVKTTIVRDLQVRDVDRGRRPWVKFANRPMIHMGRAWFPKAKEKQAAPWAHAEQDKAFDWRKGIQVWCKANNTAADIQPWPVPEGLDFVSYHTLRLLHESTENFGPIPANSTYRRVNPSGYFWTHQ